MRIMYDLDAMIRFYEEELRELEFDRPDNVIGNYPAKMNRLDRKHRLEATIHHLKEAKRKQFVCEGER